PLRLWGQYMPRRGRAPGGRTLTTPRRTAVARFVAQVRKRKHGREQQPRTGEEHEEERGRIHGDTSLPLVLTGRTLASESSVSVPGLREIPEPPFAMRRRPRRTVRARARPPRCPRGRWRAGRRPAAASGTPRWLAASARPRSRYRFRSRQCSCRWPPAAGLAGRPSCRCTFRTAAGTARPGTPRTAA